MTDKTEIAWAAGLFDGEGSLFTYKPSNRPNMVKISLAIQMTELAPIERFAALFDMKIKPHKAYGSNRKPTFSISTSSESKVTEIFETIKPYLSQHKIDQGEQAISRRTEYTKNSSWHDKENCKHGHKYTEENTKWYNGYKSCRTCARERQKEYMKKKKEKI